MSSPPSPIRRVALDAMGVLYERGRTTTVLTEFAHRLGSSVQSPAVREIYRRATEGEFGSAGVWEALGIPGEARDAEFLEARVLTPGVRSFLHAMQREGIPVGCITNDVAEWSATARRTHGLEGLAPWVVSADVGVRKPAPGIYERFLTDVAEASGAACDPGECLFVDDLVENLDAARGMGFRTAWFRRRPPSSGMPDRHPRVGRFAEVFELIARSNTKKGHRVQLSTGTNGG